STTSWRPRQNVVLRLPPCHHHNRQILNWIDTICERSHRHGRGRAMSGKELSYLGTPVERVRHVEPAPRIIRRRGNFQNRLLGDRHVPYKPDTIPRLERRGNTVDYWRDGVLCFHLCLK